MPSDKKTTPDRPRSARPSENNRAGSSSGSGRGRPTRSGGRGSLKSFWENVGWGLVIGLPIVLVILAILWRATNGFQGTPDANTFPTPAPTATAGAYLAPPALPAGAAKDRLVYVQSESAASPLQILSANLDGSNPALLTNTPENKTGVAWSPDGRQVAFTANGVGLQVVNFDGSGLHTLAYGGFSPAWSPDGKQIAFLKNVPATDGQGPDRTGAVRVLYVINADGKLGDEKQLAADVLGPNWSPDGKFIAFFSLRNAVMFTVEVATGKTEQIKLSEKLGGWYPTYTPDGKGFVFYGNPNPATMVAGLDLALTAGSVTSPDLGVTPAVAATTAAATTAAATGTPAATTTSGTPAPTTTSGTPAATTTAAATTVAATPTATPVPGPPSLMSLYRVNLDGSGLKKLQDLEPNDGSGGGKFRFNYYVATSSEVVALFGTRAGFPYYRVAPVFSPDGKTVASLYIAKGDRIGTALVPLEGGTPTLAVEGENNLPAGTRLNPVFSPDGSKLYYTFAPPKPATATGTPTANPATAAATPEPLKQLRYLDLGAKAEKTVFASNDTGSAACCGATKK